MNLAVDSRIALVNVKGGRIEEVIHATVVFVDSQLTPDGDGRIVAEGRDRNGHTIIFHGDEKGEIWHSPDRPTDDFFPPEDPRVPEKQHPF